MSEEWGSFTNFQDAFNRASDYVSQNFSLFSKPDLLYLYGRYKQALEGPCKEPMPSLFTYRKRSKWEAWECLGDMSKEEAMQQYMDKLNALAPEWDAKNKESHPKALGPVISTFLKMEPELEESSKTPFDFVKEGSMDRLKQALDTNKSIINCCDDQGLTLLHWACDRGHHQVAALLISYGINVNLKDEDGQTPLHFACSCGYETLVTLLLANGALCNIPDAEGHLPHDVAFTDAIKELVQSK